MPAKFWRLEQSVRVIAVKYKKRTLAFGESLVVGYHRPTINRLLTPAQASEHLQLEQFTELLQRLSRNTLLSSITLPSTPPPIYSSHHTPATSSSEHRDQWSLVLGQTSTNHQTSTLSNIAISSLCIYIGSIYSHDGNNYQSTQLIGQPPTKLKYSKNSKIKQYKEKFDERGKSQVKTSEINT